MEIVKSTQTGSIRKNIKRRRRRRRRGGVELQPVLIFSVESIFHFCQTFDFPVSEKVGRRIRGEEGARGGWRRRRGGRERMEGPS